MWTGVLIAASQGDAARGVSGTSGRGAFSWPFTLFRPGPRKRTAQQLLLEEALKKPLARQTPHGVPRSRPVTRTAGNSSGIIIVPDALPNLSRVARSVARRTWPSNQWRRDTALTSRFFLAPAAGAWRERSRSPGAWVKNILSATFGLGGRAPTSFFCWAVWFSALLKMTKNDEERRRGFTAEFAEDEDKERNAK